MDSEQLNSKKRAVLRSHAHHLKPIVTIGKEGLTEGALKSINNALNSHELVKIKAKGHDCNVLAKLIAEHADCIIVGLIGNIIISFKQNPDQEKSKFSL